jgi:predicted enzyme related to lactoylglutathione lyase
MSKNGTFQNAAAWFEIAVKNLDKGAEFYGAVLGKPLKRETMGPTKVAVFPHDGGMSGNLYEASEIGASAPVVHLNAPRPLEEALHRVKKHGGSVASEIYAIPSGRFAYCKDPDGTRFGLYTAGTAA